LRLLHTSLETCGCFLRPCSPPHPEQAIYLGRCETTIDDSRDHNLLSSIHYLVRTLYVDLMLDQCFRYRKRGLARGYALSFGPIYAMSSGYLTGSTCYINRRRRRTLIPNAVANDRLTIVIGGESWSQSIYKKGIYGFHPLLEEVEYKH
jgi:hypothetical protein